MTPPTGKLIGSPRSTELSKTDPSINFGYPEAKANWKETYLLKPIPQSDLDLNSNLTQNPGY